MNRVLLALLPVLLAACASDPQTQSAAAPKEAGVTCELETRTGSHMANKHCRSTEQREKDRDNAQAMGDSIRTTPAAGTR